jgi:ParB/RepB/Spo0J family partition protein
MKSSSSGQLFDVELDELDDGPNVRAKADTALKRSIAEYGVLQPITVCRRQGRFEVLYGHRRTAAARALGLARIPAILVPEPDDRPIRQLVENLHRRAVDAIDIGRALRAHLDAHPGMTRTALARQLGRSIPYVSGKLELLDMDAETQRRITAGEVSEANAIKARQAIAPRAQGRPHLLQPSDDGRSRSVVVPLGRTNRHGVIQATIGVDRESGLVDLVVDDGAGQSVLLTLDREQARLLARRLTQAFQAVAS